MKFSFYYTTLMLDVGLYQKKLDAYLTEMLNQGAQLWLNAALSIIPVWSGAAQGTFLKFANAIGQSLVVPRGVPWFEGPGYGNSKSNVIIVSSDGIHTIEYSTSLWHLWYNEYNDAMANPEAANVHWRLITPTPYNFQEKAGEAFAAFSQTVVLPSIMEAMRIKTETL